MIFAIRWRLIPSHFSGNGRLKRNAVISAPWTTGLDGMTSST